VGSLAEGRSPFGLFDMAGNVLEWTADRHDVGDGARVARGGSWRSDEGAVRITHRQAVEPSQRDASLGFRCATTETLAGAGR
jgi:formylglycine-generating enzyme required for sulfatase activity